MLNLHRLGELVLDEEILVGGHSMNEVSDEHNAQIALSVKLGIFAITKFWWFTE